MPIPRVAARRRPFTVRVCLPPAVVLACALAPTARAQEGSAALALEMGRLHNEIFGLGLLLKQREDAIAALRHDVKALGEDLDVLKERAGAQAALPVLAAAFLASPPPASDSLGVAKAPVFAPRLHVDAVRRHDTLFLKLRRIDPTAVKLVAELELPGSEAVLDLPIDRNGALYVLEWSTSEGFSYTLALRDGAGEQTAASVQVRPLLNQGRFLFVASRLD